jgi:hypothetical protein
MPGVRVAADGLLNPSRERPALNPFEGKSTLPPPRCPSLETCSLEVSGGLQASVPGSTAIVRCSSIVGEVATDPPREASTKELTLLLL